MNIQLPDCLLLRDDSDFDPDRNLKDWLEEFDDFIQSDDDEDCGEIEASMSVQEGANIYEVFVSQVDNVVHSSLLPILDF
jgi:hypothetical protein